MATKEEELLKLLKETMEVAMELAEYASYSEITGGISTNRTNIREGCDRLFDLRDKIGLL